MFTGELFPYQREAVWRICERRKILVAYSMGLGKTPITIAALERLRDAGTVDTALVIVPASLKWQWAQSLARFTDIPDQEVKLKGAKLNVPLPEYAAVIDGPRLKRQGQWERMFTSCPQYVICSYQSVLADWQYVCRLRWGAVVCDEATALKNFTSKTAKLIKRLQPPVRIALTGTPVENRAEELYSIMQWVDRDVLERWDLFDRSFIVRNGFGGIQRYKNLDLLHSRMKDVMVRKSRLDADVAPYLPEVSEKDVYVKLDKETRAVYKLIEHDLGRALDELNESGIRFEAADFYAGRPQGMSAAHGKVMSRLQALQMLVDHPVLLRSSADTYKLTQGEDGSAYAYELHDRGVLEPLLDAVPPKVARLTELAQGMLAEGAKIIVFTQFRRMLTLLDRALLPLVDARSIVLYHGGMSASLKSAEVARFQQDSNCRLFLSSDAGGYGLDLPAANYLINYDLPYSNGKFQQRNARHVRASSTYSSVFVVNLICEDTSEKRVRDILAMREELSRAITDGGSSEVVNNVASLGEHIGSHR